MGQQPPTLEQRIATFPGPSRWREESVSYYDLAKAEHAVDSYPAGLLAALDVTRRDMRLIRPFLRYFMALVYKGDRLYEQAQQDGLEEVAPGPWQDQLASFLKSCDLVDPDIKEELDNFTRYGVLESRIVLGKADLTEELVLEANILRSTDYRLLIRALSKLTGGWDCTKFLQLIQPLLLLWEFHDDLQSYEKDIDDDSFNILRLCSQLYGPRRAKRRLQELQFRCVLELSDGINAAATADLARLCVLLAPSWLPMVRPRTLTRLPRRVLVPAAKALVNYDAWGIPAIRHALPE